MVKSVFLDRDGIINEMVLHNGIYTAPWSIDEFKFKPNINISVNILKELGFYTFVVTNQPDVKDNLLSQTHLNIMHKMISKWLKVDQIIYSSDRKSLFYKPNNMMVETLIKKYNVNRDRSFMIGDSWKDIVCGHRSQLTTIFVGDKYKTPKEYENIKPNYIVKDVLNASYLIQEIDLHG